jgi:ribosomal protein L14
MKTKTCYAKPLHFFLFLFFITNTSSILAQAPRPFEGFGAVTQGGTGQQVVHVTNLNATGAGSLANAIGSNRTVVFDVAGTINNFRYDGSNVVNLTIDGRTAPSPGITIVNNNNGSCFEFYGAGCHDIIITNLRLRGDPGLDNMTITGGAYNMVIDHISTAGSHDGGIDITTGCHDISVQYCLLGPGASDWSGAMLIAYTPTRNISIHHNLFASITNGGVGERNPLIHTVNQSPGTNMMADVRNNLIWRWGRSNGTGSGYGTCAAYEGTANVVNNYYYSTASASSAVETDDYGNGGTAGSVYAIGNMSGNNGVNPNTSSNHAIWTIPTNGNVVTQDPCTAATIVRAEAGARPLDAFDQAIVNAITLPGCAVSNLPPVANAGTDITITLPTVITTLNGSGTDPDGTVASYSWSRVSGPTTFTLANAALAVTALTGLVQGTYVFRLTVTDNAGATATDDITVTVNGLVNLPPTANAGANITLTLPVNSTTLTGSGADTDGTIAGYAWTRVSGPTTFTFGTANAASTTLTGLVQGTYVFRLTVTDNGGATGTDDITVTVNPAVNQPPTANAGSNITLTLPVNSTTLTGSGTDPNGTIVSYAWTRISGPTTFTLGAPNAASTTLTGLVQGTYVFRLTVTDNGGASATDDITVTVNPAANVPPTANAGNNITLTLPTNSTTLNGSGADADGTIASYAWTRVSGPTTFTFGTANAASTTLTGLVQGTYVFRLTVTDNSGATGVDDVTVTVNPAANIPPTANAGSNIVITLPVNSTNLNGTATDPDGTIASYAWTRISGPTTFTLGTANAASTTLTGLVQGTYVFRLTVTDNSGATSTDDVTVTVNAAAPTNILPIANAGVNIVINLPVNSTTLNGSGTDADGTIASYAWSHVSGPTTYTIVSPATASTALTGLVQGVYVFTLTVTDNGGATDVDNVTVTVNAATNQAPAANAGNNITITLPVNSTTLNGAGTDIDGTIAGYAWTRVSGPTTFSITSPAAASTTLTGLVQGVYVFRLTVTDNAGATGTDDVTVTVNAAVVVNQPPIARAGTDIVMTLPVNSTTLNGNTSSDPDGTIVSYSWSRVSGPATFTLTSAGSAATGLNNLVQGVYVFRLTVTDNSGASATDDVTVTVNAAVNQPPVANAGNDIVITLPVNSTTLSGSGTDIDGTITTYAWARVSGPTTFTLTNAAAASTTLTGLVQGVYVFRLTVTDNSGATATDNITVTVNAATPGNIAPVANAGTDITITLPVNSTTLTGSGTDADGTVVTYAWTRVSGPTTYILTTAGSASTGLTNLVQGTYQFRLTVTDNFGATGSDIVTVNVLASTAVNQAPVARTNNDVVLVLPINSTTLSGGTSTDVDGIIAGFEWTQVSGPTQAIITGGLTATAGISGLTIGQYLFQLKVTDDDGASSVKTVQVTVSNANGQGSYFNIYPNPTVGPLNIEYFGNGNGEVKVLVYDILNRLVQRSVVDKSQVMMTTTIDVTNFKNGSYIIQLELPNGEKLNKQFIKM